MENRQLVTYNADARAQKKHSTSARPCKVFADPSAEGKKTDDFFGDFTASAVGAGSECMCADFIEDVLRYSLQRERRFALPEDFLRQTSVTPQMRSVVVDYLVQVHVQLELKTETFWLCSLMLDRCFTSFRIAKSDVQALVFAALHLAVKFEEYRVCPLSEMKSSCGVELHDERTLRFQNKLLQTFDFDLNFVLPSSILRSFAALCSYVDTRKYCLAEYFLNVTNAAYQSCHWLPSEMAFVSLYLSAKLSETKVDKNLNHIMQFLHISQADLDCKTYLLAKLVLENQNDTRHRGIFKKYSSSSSYCCAEISASQRQVIEQFAKFAA